MNTFEKVLYNIGKGIIWPFEHLAALIGVLNDALKDTPEVKSAVVGLVGMIAAIGKDGALAVAGKGLNLPEDLATVSDAEALFAYTQQTFLPAIEAAFKDIKKDITDVNAATVVEVPQLQPGPGLHNVTPA